jgi:hypothetical protein
MGKGSARFEMAAFEKSSSLIQDVSAKILTVKYRNRDIYIADIVMEI